MKVQLPLKVEASLKEALSSEAEQQIRSLNNYVEWLLDTHPTRGGSKNKKNKKAKNGI